MQNGDESIAISCGQMQRRLIDVRLMEALEETLQRRDADFILSSATQPHGLYWGDTARASNTTTSVSTL